MAHAPKLRYVDPYERRGRLYLALCRFSATKAGAWLAVNLAWKIDPHLLEITRGRFSTAGPLTTALLESRGARTGQPRRNATLYFHDGDRVTIIASKRGAPKNPAWYYNLRKHPDAPEGEAHGAMSTLSQRGGQRPIWTGAMPRSASSTSY